MVNGEPSIEKHSAHIQPAPSPECRSDTENTNSKEHSQQERRYNRQVYLHISMWMGHSVQRTPTKSFQESSTRGSSPRAPLRLKRWLHRCSSTRPFAARLRMGHDLTSLIY
ncbi:hypothetical protein BJX70DRAFT_378417 [Aspergillus crustosus]